VKPETEAVYEKIKQIASVAGIKIGKHPESDVLCAGFELQGGRTQMVFVCHAGETPQGQDVVCFMSPCMRLKKGLLGGPGLSRDRAIDLLRRNSRMLFGYFALHNMSGVEVLMVCSDQIVDTMEVEEFMNHLGACASIADHYEQEHGRDDF
jgi:hypothetical protein